MNLLKRLATDERGVTAIEYGLIAAGIGVAILTVVNTVGGSLVAIFTTVSNDLATAAK
jgi:pilus assembly protein Flp/PilA